MKKLIIILAVIIVGVMLLASCDINDLAQNNADEKHTPIVETNNLENDDDDKKSDNKKNDDSEDDEESEQPSYDKEDPTEEESTTEKYTFNGEENTTNEEFTTAENTEIADAVTSYLFSIYKDGTIESGSYDLINHIKIDDEYVAITWSIKDTDKVTIVEKDDNFVTLIVPETDEDIRYFLRAEFKHGDIGVLVQFAHNVQGK